MDAATSELLARLRGQIDKTLAPHVTGRPPVALLNFPNHANAGDDAVWLGAEAALTRLGARVGYRASWAAYHPDALRSAVPDGPILLNGGGNLGDVYARQQGVRERVLADFPGRAVVQLPQSIWFRDEGWVERFGAQVAAHGACTLLVRDRPSLAYGQRLSPQSVELCPDLAFGLDPRSRLVAPDVDVLWSTRQDPESAGRTLPVDHDVCVADWGVLEEDGSRSRARRGPAVHAASLVESQAVRHPMWARGANPLIGWAYRTLGSYWLDRGLAQLSRGRVVVTERLHGHVLCLLLGIPHVVLDTPNGKVSALREAWTLDSPIARDAATVEEALSLARTRVRTGSWS